jgi:hypothetical protein
MPRNLALKRIGMAENWVSLCLFATSMDSANAKQTLQSGNSSAYPVRMQSMSERVPIYRPKADPKLPVEKRRRRESMQALKMPIHEMLKELWHSSVQQQCPVDCAGQITSWPPGQVRSTIWLACPAPHALATTYHKEYEIKNCMSPVQEDY